MSSPRSPQAASTEERRYLINEMFYSLQGEGVRAGTANLFLRFSRCNLQCTVVSHGFDCDTEFESGSWMSADEILTGLEDLDPKCRWIVLTGGEPALQVDADLIAALRSAGYSLAIETNGTRVLPEGLDWITVSPKTSEDDLRQMRADEVKYVRAAGQGLPAPVVNASHRLVSPAFEGDAIAPGALEWCLQLVRDNPGWRLSVQQHKGWNIR